MKKVLTPFLLVFPLLVWAADPDTPFRQAVSVKYTLAPELKDARLKKVVVDYNDNVYVLTSKGLYKTSGNLLTKDLLYRPLSGLVPVDVAVQAGTGYLYYLYENKFLSNAHGGKPYAVLPENKYTRLSVAEDGSVLVTGNGAVALYKNEKLQLLKGLKGNVQELHVYKGGHYCLTSEGIYRLKGDTFSPLHQGKALSSLAFAGDELVAGTKDGYYGLDIATGKQTTPLQTKLPVPHVTRLLAVTDQLWAGTPGGVFKREPQKTFRYYASKRWLDTDQAIDLAADSQGNVYVLTPTGLNKIEFITQSLARKADYFERKIRDRHIRYGFIAELRLTRPGDVTSAEMIDTDNDGLWTAFYLGSQAFRYAATGEKAAKRYAWEAFEAYERLLSLNQLKGFPARSFERKGFKVADPDRWRDSPDPEWEWKGHTSSDEFVGHIFIAALLDQFVAQTEEEKKRVADFIDAILTHLLENDYYFVDIDGKPTLWGRWNPAYINWYPETIGDRRLGSTTLIAGLQLGYKLTGKEIYRKEAFRLLQEHGYLKNMLIDYRTIKPTDGYVHLGHNMGNGGWNHSDDEMAFLTYWVLYHYAFDEALQEKYKWAIQNHWEVEQPEKNALWNLITLGTAGAIDKPATLWHLREFPMDLIRYTVKNSHRKDLALLEPNFREQHTAELLPPDERSIHRHNANPFELDGGNEGKSELAGDEFLLPYWMARYLKVVD